MGIVWFGSMLLLQRVQKKGLLQIKLVVGPTFENLSPKGKLTGQLLKPIIQLFCVRREQTVILGTWGRMGGTNQLVNELVGREFLSAGVNDSGKFQLQLCRAVCWSLINTDRFSYLILEFYQCSDLPAISRVSHRCWRRNSQFWWNGRSLLVVDPMRSVFWSQQVALWRNEGGMGDCVCF